MPKSTIPEDDLTIIRWGQNSESLRSGYCTVLFCDLGQSTLHAAILGDKEYGRILLEFQILASFIVKRYLQGKVSNLDVDVRGDQLCVIVYDQLSQEELSEGESEYNRANDIRVLIDAAINFKMAWLFSKSNRDRADQERAPIPVMIGIHAGKVTLGAYPRSEATGTAVPEGYVISVAKRIESSARQGKSWQIMISEAVLEALPKPHGLETIRAEGTKATEDVTYLINEVVYADPQFHASMAANEISAKDTNKYLKKFVELDSKPWHNLLWSVWNFNDGQEFALHNGPYCHERALIALPHCMVIAQQNAYHTLKTDPWQALLLLDGAEKRAGERRFDIAHHHLLRAMAHLMIQEEQGCVDQQSILNYCALPLLDEKWKLAATLIKRTMIIQCGGERGKPLPLTKINDPKQDMLTVIENGLNLINHSSREPSETAVKLYERQALDHVAFNIEDFMEARFDVITPLFYFYQKLHEREGRKKCARIYRALCLV